MAQVSIREIREADVDAVFELLRDLAHHVGEGEKFDSSREDVRRDAFGPERHYATLVAEIDGRVAGLVVWFFTYTTYSGKRCLFVNDLIVADWARGYALGRRLMARVAAIAREHACARVDLHVHVDNDARGFYERIGMAQSNEVPYVLTGEALQALAESGET